MPFLERANCEYINLRTTLTCFADKYERNRNARTSKGMQQNICYFHFFAEIAFHREKKFPMLCVEECNINRGKF